MSIIRQFEIVGNPQNTEIGLGVDIPLKIKGSTGQSPTEYGVSSQKLIVSGKGELKKPTFSNISVIQPPQAETVISIDDRVHVLDSETLPWRMICSLEIQGTIGGAIGTGWFAGPRTIITAGHCVFHPNLGGWAKEIKIAPGRYGSDFPFPKDATISKPLTSQRFEALKGWTEDLNTDFDYAVIHLDQPVANETGWFSIAVQDDATLKGLLVNVAGYPGDRDFGRYQYFASSKIDKVLSNRFFYEADTYGGQSGGPVWFQDDANQPVVIGVHSYGVGGSFTLNSATRINTDVFQVLKNWIDAGS
jgi:glutamyl endopeptidase